MDNNTFLFNSFKEQEVRVDFSIGDKVYTPLVLLFNKGKVYNKTVSRMSSFYEAVNFSNSIDYVREKHSVVELEVKGVRIKYSVELGKYDVHYTCSVQRDSLFGLVDNFHQIMEYDGWLSNDVFVSLPESVLMNWKQVELIDGVVNLSRLYETVCSGTHGNNAFVLKTPMSVLLVSGSEANIEMNGSVETVGEFFCYKVSSVVALLADDMCSFSSVTVRVDVTTPTGAYVGSVTSPIVV